jgi:hypothetical protein
MTWEEGIRQLEELGIPVPLKIRQGPPAPKPKPKVTYSGIHR